MSKCLIVESDNTIVIDDKPLHALNFEREHNSSPVHSLSETRNGLFQLVVSKK
jgi:hypothetical protein